MKKISIILICVLVALASCTKSKEVHPELGDGNDEIVTVGMKDVHVEYTRNDIAELQKVVFHYSLAEVQQFAAAEMTKREDCFELTLNNLLSDTLYSYYYELFSMDGETSLTGKKTFHTQTMDTPEPPTPPTPPSDIPEGATNGLFTINENGDRVYFSQGNLQYQASTNTWRFAEHQWDYVGTQRPGTGSPGGTVNGSDNRDISPTYSGWIDLLGWGTSGWSNGNTYYEPWSVNDIGESYGPPGNFDLTGNYDNCDWGVYNPISNGGNTAGLWRTLTKDEWVYLLEIRSTLSGIRYAKGNVNGVNGIILLPDNWSISAYNITNANQGSMDFSGNNIDASGWSVLEDAGVVFLPSAGVRFGSSVYDVGVICDYWSTSYCDRSHSYGEAADNNCLYSSYEYLRLQGLSVRLVRNY